jgi:hypothetical protein
LDSYLPSVQRETLLAAVKRFLSVCTTHASVLAKAAIEKCSSKTAQQDVASPSDDSSPPEVFSLSEKDLLIGLSKEIRACNSDAFSDPRSIRQLFVRYQVAREILKRFEYSWDAEDLAKSLKQHYCSSEPVDRSSNEEDISIEEKVVRMVV